MDKKEQKAWIINFISVIVVLGFFAISCLFLTNIGIQVYKNVVLANDNNFELRTSLSYVATKIRQNDSIGYPRMEEKDGVKVLVLGEEIDGQAYETRIFHKDGALYELYQEAGSDYELDYGLETMEIKSFSIDMKDDKTVQLVAENEAGEKETLTLSLRTGR